MEGGPIADIDVTEPEDTDLVSQFPSNERSSRAAVLDAVNGAAVWGGTSGGSANAQTCTVSLTSWDLTNKPELEFIAGFSNTTTTPTMTVNGGDTDTITNQDGDALAAGDILAGRMHRMRFDGTNWRLGNPALGNISQAQYDQINPVGMCVLKRNETAPVVPSGITATWTRFTGQHYLRTEPAGSGGTAGGSLNTGAGGDHDHGGATGNYAGSTANYSDGGQSGALTGGNHTHTISSSSTHTHTIEPTYRSFAMWERTA